MSKKYVNDFVFGYFFPELFEGKIKAAVNVERLFRSYLSGKGDLDTECDEVAEKYILDVKRKIELKVSEIEILGLPRVLCQIDDSPSHYMCWYHPKYEDDTGLTMMPEDFNHIVNWIDSLDPREFLIPCAMFLKLAGATKIYITDSSGDQGIDCIGLIDEGVLKSTALYVQSKTSEKNDITRDTVLMEYGKYLSLPHTAKFHDYRRALGIDKSVNGCTSMYIFLANKEFKPPAREVSTNLGVLLRSRVQLAYWLAMHYGIERCQEIFNSLKSDLSASLTRNIEAALHV